MESDKDLASLISSLSIPKTHASVGLSNLIASNKQYKSLFVNRRLPDRGWSDMQIQHLLLTLSALDTNNNDPVSLTSASDSSSGRWCGVGEREGRVYSSLVAQRHFGMTHGIGRSGDITEPQPKAAGSSVIARLTLHLVLDAIRRGSGLDGRGAAANGILLPLCTGMSMSMTLTSIRSSISDEDERSKRDIVLWSRIDQKSCHKAIASAGMRCVVVPTKIEKGTDEVVTDLFAMKKALDDYTGRVLAVITTTSCFAPRVPDAVDDVARLCAEKGVAHVINNAYGLQCEKTCKLINRACVVGRVDAIVCSTDKNFLVPVGGAIVMSPQKDVTAAIGRIYPGRASAAPILDLFITLLSMGLDGYKTVLSERTRLISSFQRRFQDVAQKHGERLLACPRNTISFGMTLDHIANTVGVDKDESNENVNDVSYLGSILFMRCVSGTRVVPRGQTKKMGQDVFDGFGSSTCNFPHSYLTAACAIGVSDGEIVEFGTRLDKAFKEYASKKKRREEESKNAEKKDI